MEAQLAWEQTMAETLGQTVASQPSDAQIIVLIGKGHIRDHVGVPKLTGERVEQPYRTVAPVPIDYPDRVADPKIADFVWLINRFEPVHRVRLGVLFGEAPGKGLEILKILPNSPAAKAGLRKGDMLYRLDGMPVSSLEEVHRAFSSKMVHELILKRDNQEISVTVTLSP
jgi:S1-C subfamily serine protease